MKEMVLSTERIKSIASTQRQPDYTFVKSDSHFLFPQKFVERMSDMLAAIVLLLCF